MSRRHILGTTVVARLSTSESIAHRLSDLLVETLDHRDVVLATSEPVNRDWTVAVYFHSTPDRTAIRKLVAKLLSKTAGDALAFETLTDSDWVATSLAALKPVQVGRFVVHGRHDRARVAVNRIGIEIEAALAFGTGHHGTTRGCLLAIDHLLKARRPRRILDIGTGSGVLAIAAARASRRPVLASDVDRNAVAIARQNARANRAGGFVNVIRADGVRDRRLRSGATYDLMLAKILLQPLKRFAAPLARLAAPRGFIVLSGLLPSQANAALAAYRMQGLALEYRILLEGWATLVLTRRRWQRPERRQCPVRQLENLTR
jgi:ribosomal protein L11 methyltransferase